MTKFHQLIILLLLAFQFNLFANSTDKDINNQLMWINNAEVIPNSHLAFRGHLNLQKESVIDFQLSGASWYIVWIDGEQYTEGPDRYALQFPEYQRRKIKLSAGEHLVAVEVHHIGVDTRMQKAIQPFLYFQAFVNEVEIPIDWKCEYLKGYNPILRRIVPILSWIEWIDTRLMQNNWQLADYNDSNWQTPIYVTRPLGVFSASKLSQVKMIQIKSDLIAQGELAEVYGISWDAPGATFYLRDLNSKLYPAEGVWYRFDLGQVMLSRPKFRIDVPAGTIVEIAYSEGLHNGRVSPWIGISGGETYNIFRYIARGGVQEINPITPLGGRFVELHIMAPKSKLLDYSFIQRTYLENEIGTFACNDTLLNKIWKVGVNTHRACSEDALIDNPTRERGQWLGDFALVGLENGTVLYSDIANVRRGFVQAAQAANAEGMVVAQSPGDEFLIPSFSLQWLVSSMNYWRLTGDKTLLTELQTAAEKNINSFDKYWTKDGIVCPHWNFIDWGYVPNSGSSDMALNMHYYMGLRAIENWEITLAQKEKALIYKNKAALVESTINAWLNKYKTESGYHFDSIGYHKTVLALRAGFIENSQKTAAISAIKKHILNCFPNNPNAPRLSNPDVKHKQLITPYFASYAFPVLFENGETDFVLDQYRICWGWGINQGLTTWMEVFDLRWSHCHQWSGAPTWQLSRYVLGLKPRFDIANNRFDLDLKVGSLLNAEGDVLLTNGNVVHVKWVKKSDKLLVELKSPEPFTLNIPKELNASAKGMIKVKNKLSFTIKQQKQ